MSLYSYIVGYIVSFIVLDSIDGIDGIDGTVRIDGKSENALLYLRNRNLILWEQIPAKSEISEEFIDFIKRCREENKKELNQYDR